MLENAWYEPMLAALVGGGLLLAERRAWIGHLLIGLGVTGKQFGLPLVLPWWMASRGRRGPMLAGLGWPWAWSSCRSSSGRRGSSSTWSCTTTWPSARTWGR
jgi:hypothetical protein